MSDDAKFTPFPKIARFSRECIITEKIDGTNASVTITEDGQLLTASRTRWITPEDDNYGFAKWAQSHKEELLTLPVGTHFGEWWGQGIQRNYGLAEKRFSLFNVSRFVLAGETPGEKQYVLPVCVGLVPVLSVGDFSILCAQSVPEWELAALAKTGSKAAPGFMRPEGIVIYHTAAGICFKKTIEKDSEPKGALK